MSGPPQLTQRTSRLDVHESESTTVNLAAIGVPAAFPYPQTLRWTRDGAEVGNSTHVMLGYPEATFTNVSRSDAGQYVVTATNYQLDDPSKQIGTAIGRFELKVTCTLPQICHHLVNTSCKYYNNCLFALFVCCCFWHDP